jgi:zinc protease
MILKVVNGRSESIGLALFLAASFSHAAGIAPHVVRTSIAGIDVIAYPTAIKDVVTIVGSLPAGDVFATDNIAVATLTGALLDKGTTSKDKFAIAKQLDRVGAELNFAVDAQTLNIQARSLKADMPTVLKIMADELRHPKLSSEECAKTQIELMGALEQQSQSTEARAAEGFARAIFPVGHPNRPASLGEWQTAIGNATLSQVKAFHQKYYGPAHLTLVFVGDLDLPAIKAELKKDFGGWGGGVAYAQAPKAIAAVASDQMVPMAGKTSVTVIEGQATGLRYRDADSLPLRIGVAIFGSGFTSRLMSSVRDHEGLTYHITASMADDTIDDGDWRINASFAPSLLDKGLASTQRELHKWWQDGVTADELAARKSDLIGAFQVSLASTEGMADTLLRTVQRGLPFSWIDDYPRHVNAISIEQVNSAIKRQVDPQRLTIVKAGSMGSAANQ